MIILCDLLPWRITYTEFLLSVRGHETLLGLLSLGRFFHTFAHFGPFAVDFRLFCLLSLCADDRRDREKKKERL